MNKEEALAILGASASNFEEVVLNKLFEHKQFLLKSVITPQVFKTRAKKLNSISDAYYFLLDDPQKISQNKYSFSLPLLKDLDPSSLIAFYRVYEHLISQLKLGLMQNNEPIYVAYFCNKIADIEHEKLIQIASKTEKIAIKNLDEVKISDFINSGTIIKELLSANNAVLDDENLEAFPTLKKDIIRSKKYANFTINKEL